MSAVTSVMLTREQQELLWQRVSLRMALALKELSVQGLAETKGRCNGISSAHEDGT